MARVEKHRRQDRRRYSFAGRVVSGRRELGNGRFEKHRRQDRRRYSFAGRYCWAGGSWGMAGLKNTGDKIAGATALLDGIVGQEGAGEWRGLKTPATRSPALQLCWTG